MESLVSNSFASAVELTRSDVQRMVTYAIMKSAGVTTIGELQSEFGGSVDIEDDRSSKGPGIEAFKRTQDRLR